MNTLAVILLVAALLPFVGYVTAKMITLGCLNAIKYFRNNQKED